MPTDEHPGPSVKDAELDEKLREEGNSKQKSARIANAAAAGSRSEVGRRGGTSAAYEEWSVKELRARAAELDIGGRSSMGKDDPVEALRAHQALRSAGHLLREQRRGPAPHHLVSGQGWGPVRPGEAEEL